VTAPYYIPAAGLGDMAGFKVLIRGSLDCAVFFRALRNAQVRLPDHSEELPADR